MLVFKNKGLLDEVLVTTMAANVKTGDNPIGMFGTGLKYAIAVVLRTGGSITIYKGLRKLEFGTVRKVIRGKEFQIVTMNGKQLGFTNQLGAHWEPWMAFRELWSNCMDEAGTCFRAESDSKDAQPSRGTTTIHVDGKAMTDAYDARSETLVLTQPIVTLKDMEIHPGSSKYVFYRGIRAMELNKTAAYTYNITRAETLTEDRTLLYTYGVPTTIAKNLMTCANSFVLDKVLSKSEVSEMYEGSLPYGSLKHETPSDEFLLACDRRKTAKDLITNAGVLFADLQDRMPGYISPYIVPLSEVERKLLQQAVSDAREVIPLALTRPDLSASSPRSEDVPITVKSTLNATLGIEWNLKHNSLTIKHSLLTDGLAALTRTMVIAEAMRYPGSVAQQLAQYMLKQDWIPEELTRNYGGASSTEDMLF